MTEPDDNAAWLAKQFNRAIAYFFLIGISAGIGVAVVVWFLARQFTHI